MITVDIVVYCFGDMEGDEMVCLSVRPRRELYHLQRELLRERTRCKALEEELENPMNIHRWRKLEVRTYLCAYGWYIRTYSKYMQYTYICT